MSSSVVFGGIPTESQARTVRGQIGRVVADPMQRLCGLAFAIGGRLAHRTVERWSSPGGRRVLAIAPHPDDEVGGSAGALALHRRAGDEVAIAYVTDGRRSRALGVDADETARRRREEAEAAVRALGAARFEWFGLREGEWSIDELERRLGELLIDLVPDVVYAPSRIDFHPEHHDVARSFARALSDPRRQRPQPIVRIYQAQVPLTPLATNLVCDVAAVSDEIAAAIAAHDSQRRSTDRCRRMRRYAGRFYRLDAAEEFWQVTAGQYAVLHGAERMPWKAFVSLREHPIYDARAYLSGLGERRRLVRVVSDA